MVGAVVVAPNQSVAVHCGERKMTLSWKDLQHYVGSRGQRGAVLPRGWRKVDRLNVE
jgi:topoisomerase-4 subunit A